MKAGGPQPPTPPEAKPTKIAAPPTVPEGKGQLRLTLMATHTLGMIATAAREIDDLHPDLVSERPQMPIPELIHLLR